MSVGRLVPKWQEDDKKNYWRDSLGMNKCPVNGCAHWDCSEGRLNVVEEITGTVAEDVVVWVALKIRRGVSVSWEKWVVVGGR